MFRRRLFWPVRRPLVRGAIVGGIGYLIGRRSAARAVDDTEARTTTARLDELQSLRKAGKVDDAEDEAKRSEIIEEI